MGIQLQFYVLKSVTIPVNGFNKITGLPISLKVKQKNYQK